MQTITITIKGSKLSDIVVKECPPEESEENQRVKAQLFEVLSKLGKQKGGK